MTEQIFARGSGAYVDKLDSTYPHDVARAEQLMAQAGYPDGFAVTMPDLSRFIGNPSLNVALEQQLGAIGIDIQWDKLPPRDMFRSMQTGKYPMFFFQLGSRTPWQDLQASVLPTAAFNPFHTADPELAALIDTAQNAAPGEEQDTAFQQVSGRLVDDAWFAPIAQRPQTWAVTGGIRIDKQDQQIDLERFRPESD